MMTKTQTAHENALIAVDSALSAVAATVPAYAEHDTRDAFIAATKAHDSRFQRLLAIRAELIDICDSLDA